MKSAYPELIDMLLNSTTHQMSQAFAEIAKHRPKLALQTLKAVRGIVDPRNPPDVQGMKVTAPAYAHIVALVRSNQKIPAIKYLREVTSCGLKEAKDYVEAIPMFDPPQVTE